MDSSVIDYARGMIIELRDLKCMQVYMNGFSAVALLKENVDIIGFLFFRSRLHSEY